MSMFYKETNFKETRKGRIPKEWDVKRLGEIAQDGGIYYGLTAKAIQKETEFRMLRTTDIKGYATDWTLLPFCEITERRNDLRKFSLRKGDLVVARAGTTGVSVLVDEDLNDTIFGSYLIKIALKTGVYPKFIHYFFQSKFYWDHITSGQAGSTLKNISLPILKSIEVPLPPLPEQQKIAEVLSTLDEAIQKTNEVIAKTERLKKALMQELLTKGIGHKEYEDTEIGKIPITWHVVELREVSKIKRGPFGGSIKKEIFVSKGFKVYEQKNVIHNDLSLGHYYINEAKFNEMKSFAIKEGDVLLSAAGTIGRVTIVPKYFEPGIINQALIKITLEKSKILIQYFNYLFNYQKYREKVIGSSHGATMKNISSVRNLGSLKIPLPPIEEQQKITEILSAVDKKLELERNEKAGLERIKRESTDLLLTGKIRIKVS